MSIRMFLPASSTFLLLLVFTIYSGWNSRSRLSSFAVESSFRKLHKMLRQVRLRKCNFGRMSTWSKYLSNNRWEIKHSTTTPIVSFLKVEVRVLVTRATRPVFLIRLSRTLTRLAALIYLECSHATVELMGKSLTFLVHLNQLRINQVQRVSRKSRK